MRAHCRNTTDKVHGGHHTWVLHTVDTNRSHLTLWIPYLEDAQTLQTAASPRLSGAQFSFCSWTLQLWTWPFVFTVVFCNGAFTVALVDVSIKSLNSPGSKPGSCLWAPTPLPPHPPPSSGCRHQSLVPCCWWFWGFKEVILYFPLRVLYQFMFEYFLAQPFS